MKPSTGRLHWTIFLTVFVGGYVLHAQDHTLLFSTSDPGLTKAITNWGVSVTWPNSDNMRRSLIFMGTNEVDFVHLAFECNQPLTNGDLTAAQKADLAVQASIANIAGNKPWSMAIGTGAGVDPWYKSGADVIPSRWVQAMEAAQRYYGKPILYVEPFNEPDYGWGQGTIQNLYDILGLLQTSTNFTGTILAGGSTLNCDQANAWYDPIKARTSAGTTHALAGSFNNYAGFIQNVIASGDVPILPEAHNLMEVIAGAEYGVNRAMYWGAAELSRGSFVKACQGKRLGYSEDRAKWTAAAVYRAPNGAVEAFVGGSERMGQTTTYRLFCKDRDVFYNGNGPRRDYAVTIPGDQEKMVNITWGADVAPAINGGRYIVVNRNSGKVMEVANGNTGDGANIQQNAYSGAAYQQWDIVPQSTTYGEQSFYSIAAAHSVKVLDVFNWSYADGGSVVQWSFTGGDNQKWFFEYAGNGYFYIRSRWSGKYLDVVGASIANGATIWQWTGLNGLNQQWRLIPVAAGVEFVAPAAPAGVSAVANAVSVQLNWNANTEPDLAGYTVLRGTNSGGPYDTIARGLTNNAFTDKSANQPGTYFYAVRASDRSLNTSGNSAQVSATPSLGPTLVARYAFDGNTSDSSANANDATTNGSPAFVAGKYGSALDLIGTNQYVMLPATLMAGLTNFTIAVWVNWDGGGAWQRIFDFGNDTTQNMFLTPSSGSGTLRFAITTNGAGAEQILQSAPLPVGQWRHVTVTRSGTSARLYTNGVLVASATVTIPPGSFSPVLNYVGASQYPADPFFNGRLDEMFIYNYALSDAEITRLAAGQPPPPTVPAPMSVSGAGSSLLISWPSNYVGCHLDSNSMSVTASGSWYPVAGTAGTNQVSITVNPSASNVFFRLGYP